MSKIELYNENCFDYLQTIPDKSVSLVLIDPPYEISKILILKQEKLKTIIQIDSVYLCSLVNGILYLIILI